MKILATSLVALMMATAANAATVSYDASVGDTSTDWAQTLMLPQFDPTLGTLTKVTLNLFGRVDGTVSAENFANTPTMATLKLAAEIVASVAGATLSVVVEPFDDTVVNLTAFDGSVDFAGTSGATFSSFAEETEEAFTMANLAAFIGGGSLGIDVSATGTSTATGGGNIAFFFLSTAQATTTVTYTYDPTVIPLPAGLPLLAGALGGLVFLRRRKAA